MIASHPTQSRSSNNLQLLYHSIHWVRTVLNTYIAGETPQLDDGETHPRNAALIALSHCFGLSPFEEKILLLCAGIELDPQLSSLCAQAAGNPKQNYPTFALALALFPDAAWDALSLGRPLLYWQLLDIADNLTLTQAPISLDRRILFYLLGVEAPDPQLVDWVRPVSADRVYFPLPPSHDNLARDAVATWVQSSAVGRYPILQLCGNDAIAKTSIAKRISDTFGFHLYHLSSQVLPTHPKEFQRLRHRWERESILGRCVLSITVNHTGNSDRDAALNLFLEQLQTPTILYSQTRLHFPACPTITFDVRNLPHGEKRHLWEQYLGDRTVELNGHLEPLIAQFNLNSQTIQAVGTAIQGTPPDELPTQLWQWCRTQARPQLEHLAQRIETTATWEELVLPDKEKEVLRTIATQVKQRVKVYEQWGFAGKTHRGLGIAALFAGSSGTGKTMAAEVLAGECQLDLYRIDLSAVSSKYIGETEKNLRQIFDAAEVGGAILLFDEADALFGKRTEVKDSHDRHANLEVSYLLQRMEAYQGLAILTTNLENSLDRAFLRRLRFIINFPYPKTAERSQIWQRIFPPQTPTDGLDYRLLGKLDFAGGNIKSIALHAAFLAADAGEPVRMQHILQAARAECLKLGRALTSAETQGWKVL